MRPAPTLLAAALLACAGAVQAQFVPGNEAVRLTPNGNQVETPPVPAGASRLCAAAAACHAGAWRMVETPSGLMECTEPWARPGSCRASTLGVTPLRRVWVVKVGPVWQQCQHPSLDSHCAPLYAKPPANLPRDAVR